MLNYRRVVTGALGGLAGYTVTKVWDSADGLIGYKYLQELAKKD